MAKYRDALPQLSRGPFFTDGGIETDLIFNGGLDLPLFASFSLLRSGAGRTALWSYFETYAEFARDNRVGFVLESPTWRANADWGDQLGYSKRDLAEANRLAIAMLEEVRAIYETGDAPFVISGCVGPRGDGYNPEELLTPDAAFSYHLEQVATFERGAADMATAITMTHTGEAIGIALAAKSVRLPVSIAFTVETDGRLPTGQTLREAIEETDSETDGAPAYYMINCAHPDHFEHVLEPGSAWTERIRGLRANASRCSHAELDAAETLDDGDPAELGAQYRGLLEKLPQLAVLGGCCGTDFRHIREIYNALPVRTAA